MNHLRLLIASSVLFQITCIPTAFAGFKSGNELFEDCSDQGDFRYGYCLGYIAGIVDALNESDPSATACFSFSIPDGATQGQLGDVVTLWLKNNPKDRHLLASTLVNKALAESFPCKKS